MNLDRFIGEVQLHPVAVELDFVDPAFADGTFSIEVASVGSMNPGKSALTPIPAGFCRWNVTLNSTQLNCDSKRQSGGSFRSDHRKIGTGYRGIANMNLVSSAVEVTSILPPCAWAICEAI